jgi:transcriptional regulator with XRE-family HTH domain
MKYGKKVVEALKGDFIPAKSRVKMSPGESVKVIRELQALSQADLAMKCGIPQSTISGIESGRINLGVERARTLARSLKVHPAVLLFAGWDTEKESAA